MTEIIVQSAAAPPKDSPAIAAAAAVMSRRDGERPLSFAQERLWRLDRVQPAAAIHNVPAAYRLRGLPPRGPAALAASLAEIVRRHEALRTRFVPGPSGPLQVIDPALPAPPQARLSRVDLAALPAAARRQEEERLLGAAARRPFDLARGPLLRALLLRQAAEEWVLVLAMHAIVADSGSLGVVVGEIEALYGAALAGEPSPLPALPMQYADYAAGQRRRLQGEVLERQLAYWRERLEGHPPLLELPADRPRPASPSWRGGSVPVVLAPALGERLQELARRRGEPLFMILLGGFAALLYRCTGQADVLVGTPSAGRNRQELQGLIGLFANTLVLRIDASGDPSFGELVNRARETALGAYAHADVPLERIVEELAPERSVAGSPWLQVAFAQQTAPPAPRLAGATVETLPLSSGRAKFDLALSLGGAAGALCGELEFTRELFDAATARRLASHLGNLLAGAVEAPETPLAELPLLAEAERQALLVEWNATRTVYPAERALGSLFLEQARRRPEASAVLSAQGRLTYGELASHAAALASRLRAAGVEDEDLVAVCAERSPELVVAMLAVVLAAGAYVPLDPAYPGERLALLLEDSGARVVLTQEHLAGTLPQGSARLVLLDRPPAAAEGPRGESAGRALQLPAAAPEPGELGGDRLAYVIYTSGSTGRPKGVGVPHRAVVRLVLGTDYVRIAAGERVAQAANASFDAATFEIWGPLLCGGTVAILAPEVVLSPAALAAEIRRLGIGSMFLTASLFNQVAREAPGAFAPLGNLVVGGEAVDPASVRAVLRDGPPRRLLNGYGPTENTTFSTWALLATVAADAAAVPIGRPLANSRSYVLDGALRPVPVGVHGSLYLGGDGLARAYLGRPELTAERFVPDPFTAEAGAVPGGRLYATGDLVRQLADGEVEFLGRADQQVKIRGYRIEPGEIEAALAAHPQVRAAVVLPRREPAGLRLVAYVVTAAAVELTPARPPGTLPDAAALRRHLLGKLPDHMVPSAFVVLPALPLTPNGKADRRALAAMRLEPPAPGEQAAPRTPVEEALAAVWAQLLGVERVGVRDDFFALGGHSLLAIQALSRIRLLFGVEMSIRELFAAPTVEGLASAVERRGGRCSPRVAAETPRASAATGGAAPRRRLALSFAQQRLWFLDRMQPGTALYNVPFAYRLEGRLAPAALRASLGEIVRRHEALRTRFTEDAGGPVQVIAPAAPAALPQVDLAALPEPQRGGEERRVLAAAALAAFDLERGPLLRALLLRGGAPSWVLALAFHHIVTDGWSMDVLMCELEALYGAALAGLPSPLPELPQQYAEHAARQRRRLEGEEITAQLAWWRRRLAGCPPLLELPADRPRPAVASFRGGEVALRLPAAAARQLRELGRRSGASLFMVALGGFAALLHRYTGRTDLPIGTPHAGRDRLELEGLIGFFANTLVLRQDLTGDPTFTGLVERVRDGTLDALAQAELPFDRLVEDLSRERSLSYSPLFQVSFGLHDQPPQPRLAGLAAAALPQTTGVAKFDLTVRLADDGEGLAGVIEYAADLFERPTIARMAEHLRTLLAAAAAGPQTRLSELALLTPAERGALLLEWNDTARGEPPAPLVHEQVGAQARRRPWAVAVVDGGVALTYGELEARSNRLAHTLRSLGVAAEARVAICADRTAERVVAVLAVLKAGGVFVSLDPAYPRERLRYLLADAQAAVVLVEPRFRSLLPACAATVIGLDDGALGPPAGAARPPAPGVHPENLAYVIYTSGSAGMPKGAAVTHRALLNLVLWFQRAFGLGAEDRGALIASPAFDASIVELWPYLAAGAAVCIPDEEARLRAGRTVRWWAAQGITVTFLPTPLAEAVLEERLPAGLGLRLRVLTVGGDRLRRAARPGTRFLVSNQYGPAEACVVATEGLVTPAAQGLPSAPPSIGRPIANVRVYVLDRHLQPLPAGVPGELHIAGASLGRGYLRQAGLTAARFLPDPWGGVRGEPGARVYATGDLVRWLADGRLDFLGRLDQQVKLRGMRVEPREIEAVLAQHPGVREAVVLARHEPAGLRLVAYVVTAAAGEPAPGSPAAGGGALDVAALRRHLLANLPDYMVPGAFVVLPALPLTPNGKVDGRALAAMALPPAVTAEPVAPRTPLEKALAAIWTELLGADLAGVRDDFFALGGHSLLATQVLSRVRRRLGVELGIRDFFAAPTIEGLAGAVERRRGAAAVPAAVSTADIAAPAAAEDRAAEAAIGAVAAPPPVEIAAQPRGDEIQLSFAQQRLWFLDRMQPETAVYNVPAAYRLRGRLPARGPAALAASLAEIVRRHEALRTRFVEGPSGPLQVVDPARAGSPSAPPAGLPWVDLAGLPEAARRREEERRLAAAARRPFDLARGPLLRPLLLRLAVEEWALVLVIHHIVSDGWSLGVMLGEIEALYGAALAGEASPLPEPSIQYADYAIWQRRWLQGEVLGRQLAYWRQRLEGHPPVLELPVDRPRPATPSWRGGSAPVIVAPALGGRLRELARRRGEPLFMTLLGGFVALLHRYTAQTDVLVGTPSAGRSRQELEGLVGFFVNMLVLRTDASGDPSFGELVSRARETALGAYAHADVPFERIVEELAPERSLSESPLFQVAFVLQTAPQELPRLAGVAVETLPLASGTAMFDLTVSLGGTAGELCGELEYSRDLFDAATARRLASHLENLLAGAVQAPETPLSKLPLLSEAERRALLVEWNATRTAYPSECSLGSLFMARARQLPAAAAVLSAQGRLTYAELAARAAALAARLRAAGVEDEEVVAVCAERSPDMVVAMLAVVQAGGAYVPLDPTYPSERLAFLLADAGARVVLTQERLAGLLPAGAARRLLLDRPPAAAAVPTDGGGAGRFAAAAAAPGDGGGDRLACVIYTSGSTGRPKGVAVPHRAVVRLALGTDHVRIAAGERVAQAANASFDAATFEVWATLLCGGTVAILPQEVVLSPAALAAEIRQLGIGSLFLTTALFNQVAREAPGAFAPLGNLLFGGEAADPASVRAVLRDGPPRRLLHLYGPAENTTFSTWALVEAVPAEASTVSIGRPLANSRSYVLDGALMPVPLGVHGSLYVGGDGLARGYLGRPDLTAERFVPDPFTAAVGLAPGGRLYATGDLVRQLPDGGVEFLGRADQQVKIRGYRIEPGEIETVLAAHPQVREAVVLARREPAGLRLVAYVVTAAAVEPAPAKPLGTLPDAAALRRHLLEKLPDYMVPGAFVTLPALPLTPNGKVDRRALAAMRLEPPAPDEQVAPRTPLEEALAAVWRELLGVERVGVRDDFFALGGHSLLAIQVVSRIRRLFGVEIGIREVFATPTVAALAVAVESRRAAPAPSTAPSAPTAPPLQRSAASGGDSGRPLSFAQQRLWFLDRLERGTASYNMPLAYRLRGDLDPAALAAALREVVRRHEALRTRFAEGPAGAAQWIDPPAAGVLALVDLAALPAPPRAAEEARLVGGAARRPFDLERGPLLRTLLLRHAASEWVLMLAMHHVISDGWSMAVMLREIEALYAAALAGAPSPLPEPPFQYADFALWQRRWLEGGEMERQLAYWRRRLAGRPPLLELPADRPRPAVRTLRGASEALRLAAAPATLLREVSRQSAAPLFMTTLAVFLTLLHRYTGETDLLVGTPTAGRGRIELEGMIGFFVNTLVLRTSAAGDPPFREMLGRVRETALAAYAHADLPFERLIEELAPERSLSTSPLFQQMFVLQAGPLAGLPHLAGLVSEEVPLSLAAAKFDLTVALTETAAGLAGEVEYSRDLFDTATVRRLVGHLCNLLAGAAADPAARLSQLPLLSTAERRELLVDRNATRAPYPAELSIAEVFWAQALRDPAALAVVAPNGQLTYGELAARAAALAARLRAAGIGPERLVAVCTERTLDMVVAMLAVLTAGGAYVPLDPTHPRERLALLLADSGAAVVLTQEHLLPALPAPPSPPSPQEPPALPALPAATARVLLLDRPAAGPAAGAESPPAPMAPGTPPASLAALAAPPAGAGGDRLAQVTYTSGSTGRPKGVAVPHRAVLRLVLGSDYLRIAPRERVAQAANASFDAAVFEIWSALLNGGTVAILPPDVVLSPAALAADIRRLGIRTLFLTTALFNQVAREAPGAFAPLDSLLFGGEAVDPGWVRAVLRDGPPRRLLHVYGPTENATFSTWHETAAVQPAALTVPIGRPIANSRAYLLDAALQPVPVGVHGSLYLGGDGLARGYLGRPELTAERFVPDPFTAEAGEPPGGRLYSTGDLVRQLPDGSLEFLGRADQQVKIRGYRIELGEIETVLAAHPEVAETVVVARQEEATGKRLVAYLVAAGGGGAAPGTDLRGYLKSKLPDYMVPSAFVWLPELPLTPNGKVDRRALPAPGLAAAAAAAPRTQLEEVLAGIFREVFGLPAVGIHDDFFALGGHSLLATQVVARVRRVLAIELDVRNLFEEPTVAGLARRIETHNFRAPGAAAPPPRALPRRGEERLPLSFAQQRLWLIDRLEPGSPLCNVPLALHLEGRLSIPALRGALGELVRRHETLRTLVAAAGGEPLQVIASAAAAPAAALPLVDLTALAAAARGRECRRLARQEARRPFDLARGPLARFVLARLAAEEHVFLLTLHHIISDAGSMEGLIRELGVLHGGLAAGTLPILPALPLQYADYAVWQREWLRGEVLETEIAHWRARLAGTATLDLPADRPRPAGQSSAGGFAGWRVPPPLAARLQAAARAVGGTPFILLMAVFQALLARLAGASEFNVGTPIAGRPRIELEGLIGLFANTLVLRASLAGDPPFAELVSRVRGTALVAHAHRDLPFAKLVEALEPESSLSLAPLFQVMFVLLDSPQVFRLPGLAVTPIPAHGTTAKLDLVFAVGAAGAVGAMGGVGELGAMGGGGATGEGLEGRLEYRADLFDPATAARLIEHLETLLDGALRDSSRRVADLPLLAPAARAQLLWEWNDTAAPAPWMPQHERFAAQARRSPAAPAVRCRGEELTYAELAARAERLARHLAGLGVRRGTVVGVCLERSLAVPAAVLAVSMAGGALLPLDPDGPAERLASLVAASAAPMLLSQRSLAGRLPAFAGRTLFLETLEAAPPSRRPLPALPPLPAVEPDDLAYVIHGTESSGEPNGIAMTHGALANLVAFHAVRDRGHDAGHPGGRDAARTLQYSPLSSGVSFQELFSTWAAGGTLVLIADGERRDPDRLLDVLAGERIARLFLPAGALHQLAAAAERRGAAPAALREVITTGEPLQASPAVGGWFRRLASCTLENQYGPPETQVVAALALPRDVRRWAALPPAGRPLPNLRVHLLDPAGAPVPIGVAGEIFLGGAQMARGYLGRPDLTAERFGPDALSGRPGERLYRTGDRARHLPDGNLEWRGRMDDQVKVRGRRIELSEIEMALAEYPAVAAAVAAAPAIGRARRLVAYLVPAAPAAPLDLAALKAHLEERLPAHAVPSHFVVLPGGLPLTAAGKVDRPALPVPGGQRPEGGEELVAPRTALEELVAGIWAEVLHLDQVGIHDNFWDLGGRSPLAAKVLARIHEALGVDLPLQSLFRSPTLVGLTTAIGDAFLAADAAGDAGDAPGWEEAPTEPAS